jgi:hypothetical protein
VHPCHPSVPLLYPLVSNSEELDLEGPSGGDLPLGDKPAIESYLCDEVTLMALPMSPILKESFFPPDDSQNPPPDHVADHANVSIFG